MPRVRLLPLGFLLVAAIALAVPILLGLLAEAQQKDPLYGGYYMVFSSYYWFSLVFAPIVFGITYLAGQRFAGFELRGALISLHLVLWILGAGLLLSPQLVIQNIQIMSETYFVDYWVLFDFWSNVMTIGYCVTLLSSVVFAICFGEAIFKRLRKGKEL